METDSQKNEAIEFCSLDNIYKKKEAEHEFRRRQTKAT